MNRQYNKDRYDSLWICGYVIKKNQSRCPTHVQSMRQLLYHTARGMLRKAKLPKNGSCETFLERWSTDAVYRKSLSDEGWTEEQIRQYDTLALENHSYEATLAERSTLGKELACCFFQEYKVRQDNALIFVKRSTLLVNCIKNLLKVPDKEISQSIQHNKEGNTLNNNLMNTRSTPIRFTLEFLWSSSSSWQMAAEQQMEVDAQSWDYWRSSTWTEQ